MSNGISMERVDEIIDGYGCKMHHLIAIMQDIQAEYKYLSPAVLERIAQRLDEPELLELKRAFENRLGGQRPAQVQLSYEGRSEEARERDTSFLI